MRRVIAVMAPREGQSMGQFIVRYEGDEVGLIPADVVE